MALSDDQKAMLRLLAQREQGYDDLASLMGLSVDEVRARVQEALEEIDSDEAIAPAPEPAKAEPVAAPKAPAPVAEKPVVTPKATPPPPAPAARRKPPKVSLPTDGRMRIVAGAAATLAIILIFALVAGVFGGSGGDDGNDASTSTTADTSTTTADTSGTTQAILSPPNGGDASGEALFGKVRKTAVLQVQAEGLTPSPSGELYAVWLYHSPRIALRVGAVRVSDSGGINAQFPLPTEVLSYVAGGGFDQIDVSLTSTAAYNAEVAAAKRDQRLPDYTGESVLRGEITGRLVEAGARAKAQANGG